MNADGSGVRRLAGNVAWRAPVWSPDGRRIAFTDAGIYVMNTDGTGQRRLITRDGGGPAWSPDGRRIAFAGSVGRGFHNMEIYVVNADGSEQRRLTHNTWHDSNPVWSPDGRRIAFESNRQVWVMNADGSGQRRLTRTNGARNVAIAWSPDGRRIAFERQVGRQKYRNTALEYGQCSRCEGRVSVHVYVMNAEGSEARKLAQDSRWPVWSPDGRKIAFGSGRDGNPDIYVMNADGSGQRNLTRTRNSESRPVWSPAQKK
jgi:Tol biopolymer transport system component